MTALRVCTIFVGSVRGRIARGWKMSMLIFHRWDSVDFGPVESRAWSKTAPILMGSTGHVFAPYWSEDWPEIVPKPVRRLHGSALHPKGHLPKPVGCTYGFMLYWAKTLKNTENWENACDSCIAEGCFRKDFPRTTDSFGSQVLRAGVHPWVSCSRPKHYKKIMPWSHEALGQSTGPVRAKPVNAWEITRHA